MIEKRPKMANVKEMVAYIKNNFRAIFNLQI